MVYTVALCCEQMHLLSGKKKQPSQNTNYTSLYYCHGYTELGKKRVCSTDLLKWAKISKIRLAFVFLLQLVSKKLQFALMTQNTERLPPKLLSSFTRHRPCPPTCFWSKSKTCGGQRHSWSVALRPHEQPVWRFGWSLAFIFPPPPFLLPAFDGCEMTLKRVPYVLDKMGLFGVHLRFNEHVF